MGAPDPELAILHELARPAGQAHLAPPSLGGVQAGIVEGGNWFEAELETVRFVKWRQTERRRLYFVTFAGSIPHVGPEVHKLSEIYSVTREADGSWTATGGAGGGDEEVSRAEPWVNLAGGGWREHPDGVVRALADHFYAGGRLHPAGVDVARVQLRFTDGTVLEDGTEHAIVLFISDAELKLPADVVLLDPAGLTVGVQAFPGV